jgi:hypothetical protein
VFERVRTIAGNARLFSLYNYGADTCWRMESGNAGYSETRLVTLAGITQHPTKEWRVQMTRAVDAIGGTFSVSVVYSSFISAPLDFPLAPISLQRSSDKDLALYAQVHPCRARVAPKRWRPQRNSELINIEASISVGHTGVHCVGRTSKTLQSGIHRLAFQRQQSKYTLMNAPEWFGSNQSF